MNFGELMLANAASFHAPLRLLASPGYPVA